ncbi:MAG: hypothetical protein GPJ51_06990 [Candidatus Heimdallarchaeota archaeon]|nr:hypothetical protein [Candidatus Heimdallarchaeota archaeon]
MKKKKKKLSMSLSVLIIGFLLSTSSLNKVSTQALLEGENNQFNTDSFDQSTWKWSIRKVVSTESTAYSAYPSLAVDSTGNIHIAWYDVTDYAGSGTDGDIFYKRWEDSTSSWTMTEVVSTESTGHSGYPSLAVDTLGDVHIVWMDVTDYAGNGTDYDIFYKRWEASTSSWTTTEVLSVESIGGSQFPSLATDTAGNVYVAWEDWANYAGSGPDCDIFYKLWNASTCSWTTTELVSTESIDDSLSPSLATDTAGNVHTVWRDITDDLGAGTDDDIFYKRWEASTSSWTMTEVVSTDSTSISYDPSLATDTLGNVHTVWSDFTDYAGSGTDIDIFYKRWESSSSSWTTTEVVSTESNGSSECSSLATDLAGNIHIAWYDNTDYAGAGTDKDIFYKRWDTSSSSWTTTEVVSSDSTGNSQFPSLATDAAGKVHVAWEDYNIFYKLFSGPPPPPELAFIVPNPTELPTVYLDWNDVLVANTYYVYRSTSYIWSIEELVPITTVSSSEYIDTLPSEGFYYYVVVVENNAGNSSHSNCQYVEVKFPDLEAPELAPILPNPTDSSSISLKWDSVDGATEYHVYRSTSYIWSVDGLTPFVTTGSTSQIHVLPSEGYYFYVIVASDGARNSTHSNCEYVEYELPHVREFAIVSGLILATFVLVFVVTGIRKKKSKLN